MEHEKVYGIDRVIDLVDAEFRRKVNAQRERIWEASQARDEERLEKAVPSSMTPTTCFSSCRRRARKAISKRFNSGSAATENAARRFRSALMERTRSSDSFDSHPRSRRRNQAMAGRNEIS
jgi:hypothetical protein